MKIYLKTPTVAELDYRIWLYSDVASMAHNAPYGDDDVTGAVAISRDWIESWFRMVSETRTTFYAYIVRAEDGKPVGEARFHNDTADGHYEIDIVVEAAQRGRGYGTEALRSLLDVAFFERGLDAVYCEFPQDYAYAAAEKLFHAVGFRRVEGDALILTRETYASHTFLLASSNAHKIAEMRELLAPQGIRLLAPSDIGLDLDVDETGETFRDNALLKARAYCAAAKLPAIADDSGLCVDALDGAPGVYSARYGGTSGDAAHIALLLKNLDGATDRAAKFVCAIACVFPNGDELRADGECHGEIARETRGDNGFGYDPVFWLPQFGKSMAELTAAEKNAMSHRGLAVREFSEKLERYLHND